VIAFEEVAQVSVTSRVKVSDATALPFELVLVMVPVIVIEYVFTSLLSELDTVRSLVEMSKEIKLFVSVGVTLIEY
jgi:hypothetical protein